MKVVIIDDDHAIRVVLSSLLKKYLGNNLELFTSDNGVEGLGLVFISTPDLIIIDTTLPRYAGLELIDYIRSNEKLVNSKINLILIGEKDLPENLSNFNASFLDKRDPSFVEKFHRSIEFFYTAETGLIKPTTITLADKLRTLFGAGIIKWANSSDIIMHRITPSRLPFFGKLKRLFNYFLWLLCQAILAFDYTIFLLMIRKQKDSSIVQHDL